MSRPRSHLPFEVVVGHEQEDLAAANALMDYTLLTTPTMIVNRSSGDHLAVSTDIMILPDVAEIALTKRPEKARAPATAPGVGADLDQLRPQLAQVKVEAPLCGGARRRGSPSCRKARLPRATIS